MTRTPWSGGQGNSALPRRCLRGGARPSDGERAPPPRALGHRRDGGCAGGAPPRHVQYVCGPVHSRQDGSGAAAVHRPCGAVRGDAGAGRRVRGRKRADGVRGGRVHQPRKGGARQGAAGAERRALPPLFRSARRDGVGYEARAVPGVRAAVPGPEAPLWLATALRARAQQPGGRRRAGSRCRASATAGPTALGVGLVSGHDNRIGRGDCPGLRLPASTSVLAVAYPGAAVHTAAVVCAAAAAAASVTFLFATGGTR